MPLTRQTRVLLDTMAIVEAHRVACWNGLTGYFSAETVEECVVESATGNENSRCPIPVDLDTLRTRVTVHPVSDEMLAALRLAAKGVFLDAGEEHLLAFTAASSDVYVICSADGACMRVAKALGILDRLVSLETVAEKVGHRGLPLRVNFTEKWHAACCERISLVDFLSPQDGVNRPS